jgi:hypothetical protein
MSISYQPKDASVQGLQLKVQELVVMKADAIYSDDGTDLTVDVKEEVSEVRVVLFSNPGVALSSKVATLSSDKKQIKVASLVLGADDALIIKYVAK